jgi:hypothetical protein
VPYVSKEERERAKWLDLGRLEAHVCTAEGCSQGEAREQIARALGDGAIWPLRWDPEPASPPYRGSGVRLPGSPPPSRGPEDWRVLDHWWVVKLDWERSRVFDDFERAAYPVLRRLWHDDDPMVGADDGYSSRARPRELPKPRRSVWRQLLLDRAACEAIWPPGQIPGVVAGAGTGGGAMSALTLPWSIVPPPILARDALNDTVDVLRRFYFGNGGGDRSDRSLHQEIELAYEMNLTNKAVACLRTACAAGDLTMVVFDERTHSPHVVPAAYFDHRPAADLEFARSYFGTYELPEVVAADPLYKFVRFYRGWVHGFIEADFRAWLVNTDIGPIAGPRMRPFFHYDPNASADQAERAGVVPREHIEHPPEQAGNNAQKAAFLAWMEAQKQEYGTYPPTDCRNKVGRPGWRNWATENHVARETVRDWRASKPDFLIRRGRPA